MIFRCDSVSVTVRRSPSYFLVPTKTENSLIKLEFICTTRLIRRLNRMMAGGLQRTRSRSVQKRAQSCDRSADMDLADTVIQEASGARQRKPNRMAEVTSLLDSRFTQMRSKLDGLIHTRSERLDSDLGTRIMALEMAITSLETSTRQQIDLGAAASERTTEHVNNEITEMNTKLDNVNHRLGDMEAQLADISPSVAQYRREGMQALQDLSVSTGGIRASITNLRQADEQRRQKFRALRE